MCFDVDELCYFGGVRVILLLSVICAGIQWRVKRFPAKAGLKALALNSGTVSGLLGNGSDSVYKMNKIAHLSLRIITYYVMR